MYTLASPQSRVWVQARRDDGGTSTPVYQDVWWFYDGLGQVIQQQTVGRVQGRDNILTLVNTAYDNRGQVARVSQPYTPMVFQVPSPGPYPTYLPFAAKNSGTPAGPGVYVAPAWLDPCTTHTYDALGREVQTIQPGPITTTITHTQWTQTTTDANGHQRQSETDALGRVIRVHFGVV